MGKNRSGDIRILKWLIAICIIAISLFGGYCFYHFKDGKYTEWLVLISGLSATLASGIITMIGVVLTINRTIEIENRNINIEKKKEKEIIKKWAFIISSEIKSHVNSIKEYSVNIIETRLFILEDDEKSFSDFCENCTFFDNIYFISSDIKDKFYEVLSKSNIDNKEQIINSFINFYTRHERVKKAYYDGKVKSTELFDNILLSNLNHKILKSTRDIIRKASDIKKQAEKSRLPLDYYREEIFRLVDELYELRNVDFRSRDVIILLDFLKNIYEE